MHHHHHHLNHPFMDAALVGAVGLGAYELWHHHQYGTWGFGNPYNQGGAGGQYGYGDPYVLHLKSMIFLNFL
ncbi:unnamed protein product [Adineta steineri]|uniref:Uncharacterized protein n=1 Tax=Adineta steineri TaxID=433720 RepID=A0A815MGI4_9BILA|nr:unnamed protein product [Adineta steineri]CAF3708897.1 unnamed protein product [Adineta steineri]